jgi:hypothetical protein
MPNQLPRPVAGYVSSGNTGDGGALASWSAPDALVRDEVDLEHVFEIAGDKIVSLEVR